MLRTNERLNSYFFNKHGMFSLRICRYCYKPLSLSATKCPHCKKKTLPPNRYKRLLTGMAIALVIAFTVLAFALIYYLRALFLYA
jgi:ribosomal protein L40E